MIINFGICAVVSFTNLLTFLSPPNIVNESYQMWVMEELLLSLQFCNIMPVV